MGLRTVCRITCDGDGCLEAREGAGDPRRLRRLLGREGWEITSTTDRCPKHKRRLRAAPKPDQEESCR